MQINISRRVDNRPDKTQRSRASLELRRLVEDTGLSRSKSTVNHTTPRAVNESQVSLGEGESSANREGGGNQKWQERREEVKDSPEKTIS